ncbi:PREDICTED: transmembrane protein 192 [Habropoda laboriosa]|nr:PREDICTED: transmembrane protein 192 [Habropoda laboriosa]XP_017792189.1 PREDICTED: transmembrane protein 192 [Habropoda laboriosa]
MDEEESFQPILTSQEEGEHFQKLDTIPIVSVSLLFGVSLEIVGILFLSVWPEEENKCDTYFIYLYLHCVYWLIVMLTDHLVKRKHFKLRIRGYFNFYQVTYRKIRAPLFIVSLWTVCYLLLAVILHHTHKVDYEQYCHASEWFTPLNYILLLTTLEVVIIVPVYIYYIKAVLMFNRWCPLPDVAQEDWLSSFNQNSYSGSNEVGYHSRGINLEELLEKQADLIKYLKISNAKLCKRILLMTTARPVQEVSGDV